MAEESTMLLKTNINRQIKSHIRSYVLIPTLRVVLAEFFEKELRRVQPQFCNCATAKVRRFNGARLFVMTSSRPQIKVTYHAR